MVRVAEEKLRKLSLPLLGGTLGLCTMQASESYLTGTNHIPSWAAIPCL